MLEAFLEILKKGTEEVANFIKKIFEPIKKWVEELFGGVKADEAIESLLPKNTLSKTESRVKIKEINKTLLQNKNAFNPSKAALKKLGIKIPKSANGLAPDFAKTPYLYKASGSEKSVIKIKLTGDGKLDESLAYEISKISRTKEYTWHHLDDYNPITNECTMQLVERNIHIATGPHLGAVKQIEVFLSIIYKR